MSMDGFFDYNRPNTELFNGDFYAEQEEVSRGACLDQFFPTDVLKGKQPFSDFEALEPSFGSSGLDRFITFPGTERSQELPVGTPSGRYYTSSAAPSALLQALVTFFTEQRDAVIAFKPEKFTMKAHVNVQHSLLKLKVGFSQLETGHVALAWTRSQGDSHVFVQTAQAACEYTAQATRSQVQLAESLAPSLAPPSLGGLAPPSLGGLAPPSLGGLARPMLGLAPPGFSQPLAVPPCTEADVQPIVDMAQDPEDRAEGATSLAKLLDSPDAHVVATVLAKHWELVEALLLAPACVLAAPAMVEKLLDQVDVPRTTGARLADACASRLEDEGTQLGRRQLAKLLRRMLDSGVDVPADFSSKLAALAAKGDEDVPTNHFLSEATFALSARQPCA